MCFIWLFYTTALTNRNTRLDGLKDGKQRQFENIFSDSAKTMNFHLLLVRVGR